MKHKGSFMRFTRERNDDLIRAYRRECARAEVIRLDEIGRRVVDSPSRRFWVSETRAMIVCSEIMRGRPVLESMRPSKREMFQEIYRRVCALRLRHPDWSLFQLAAEVVSSPAPKFYMEPGTALQHIFKIKNGWYERRDRKAVGAE